MVYKSSVRYFHALHKFVHTYLLGFYFVKIFLLLSFLNLLKTNLRQIVHVEGEDGSFWVVKQRVLPEFEFWSAHLLIINKVSRELDQLAFPCFCLALQIFNLSSEGHEVDLHLLTEGRFFLLRIPLAFLNELVLHVLHFSVHTSRQVYRARDVFNILNTPSYEFLDELKFLNVFFKHWLKVFLFRSWITEFGSPLELRPAPCKKFLTIGRPLRLSMSLLYFSKIGVVILVVLAEKTSHFMKQ